MNIPLSRTSSTEFLSFLKSTELFSSLEGEALKQLLLELEECNLQPGDVLIQPDQPGDRLYILVTGSLKIVQPGIGEGKPIVTTAQPGQSFGEVALITGERSTSSVIAEEACLLASLSKAGLGRIASRSPGTEAQIIASIQRAFHNTQLRHLLAKSDAFGSLGQQVLEELQSEFSFETIDGGKHLIQQGDPSTGLYLVISGRLGVFTTNEDGEKKLLIELDRGQTVGEMGLITHEARNADVYALRDCLLAWLPSEGFKRLLDKYPNDILEHFAGASIQRLTSQIQGKPLAKKVATSITILPAQQDIPLKPFASALLQAMQVIGSTVLINSRVCEEQLGLYGIAQASAGDPANTRLMLWLSEQEAGHQYVIYESDPANTPWTERCLRQADRILLLCTPRKPQAGQLDLPDLAQTPASLVLLYEEDVIQPEDTRAALDRYGLHEHFKVRVDGSSDFARLARLLTGNGIGLVLSGGGARAVAQMGVLRALIEAGLEIDATCGASAGGVNAALLAMGLQPTEALKRYLAANKAADYTFPIHSLTAGKNWTASFHELMGDWQIEDLWLEFFCFSANLTRSSLTIHRSGSLFQAIRASTSIPGILPPVYYNGDILVDGGLINNFPANIMNINPRIGFMIGIDVSESRERAYQVPFGYSVSGWRSLLARFLPFLEKPKIPNILEILSEAMTINKSQSENSNRSLVDLYLSPPTQGFNMMDFKRMEEIAEGGYEYGQKVVAEGVVMPSPRFITLPTSGT